MHSATRYLVNDNAHFWQKAGDTIIVEGDFNYDIRIEQIKLLFQELYMTDSITGNHDMPPQNTYDRGSVPIYGIFCSASLVI